MKLFFLAFLALIVSSAWAKPGEFYCTSTTIDGRNPLTYAEWVAETMNAKCDKTKHFSVSAQNGAESKIMCCIEKS